MKARRFWQRALTDLFSMTPWPLELCGAIVLWHYGDLFTSNQVLSRDYRGIIERIMPNDTWGLFARSLAYALFGTCLLTWLRRMRLYILRIVLATGGMIVWGVLNYSAWRADIPFAISRFWLFFLGAQIYIAMLVRARQLGESGAENDDGEHRDDANGDAEGGTHGLV